MSNKDVEPTKADPQLYIPIKPDDKALVEWAAEHSRLATASWCRNVLVMAARKLKQEDES